MNEPSSAKILLVDDEVEFRQAASRALTRQGFHVVEAESGERAIAIAGETLPDLVVLDLRMEGMDGVETLRRLREIQQDLPVIILTGHGRFADALAGIRYQIVDFVQKPVDLKRLGAMIREHLAGDRVRPLREVSIRELMVPAEGFARVYVDQTISDVVQALSSLDLATGSNGGDPRRGTLLVFDRQERFEGLIRVRDVVWMMVPKFLRESPYSSYFTGMFLAQTKIVGRQPIVDLIRPRSTVSVDAPLMEAVHAMECDRVGLLPVLDHGHLVGLLRAEDLFTEIALSILGVRNSTG
jgi:CheY-like chemotaxis protein